MAPTMLQNFQRGLLSESRWAAFDERAGTWVNLKGSEEARLPVPAGRRDPSRRSAVAALWCDWAWLERPLNVAMYRPSANPSNAFPTSIRTEPFPKTKDSRKSVSVIGESE